VKNLLLGAGDFLQQIKRGPSNKVTNIQLTVGCWQRQTEVSKFDYLVNR
jgi:hypothetical protein